MTLEDALGLCTLLNDHVLSDAGRMGLLRDLQRRWPAIQWCLRYTTRPEMANGGFTYHAQERAKEGAIPPQC